MSKMKALFSAGIVTSLVIVVLVGLSIYNHRVDNQAAAGDIVADDAAVADAEVSADEAAYIEALNERQGQLDEVVAMMEARRTDYADQLETANQVIEDMEVSIAELEARIETNEAKIAEYEPQLAELNYTVWSLIQTRDELAAQEAEYTAQIEAANATILALQDQIR
jgi:chromosome segregation ATPase